MSDRANQLCEKYSVDQAMGDPQMAIDEAMDSTMEMAISLIDYEVTYHLGLPIIPPKGEVWANGFIEGLRHARNLLIKCKDKSAAQSPEHTEVQE